MRFDFQDKNRPGMLYNIAPSGKTPQDIKKSRHPKRIFRAFATRQRSIFEDCNSQTYEIA